MSKKVYICDTSVSHFTVQATGNSNVSQSFGTQANDYLGYEWGTTKRPNGVQLAGLSTASRTSTLSSGTEYILQPSKIHKSCHFMNLKLIIFNTNTLEDTANFVQLFRSKVNFVFTVNVRYYDGSDYNIKPLKISMSPFELSSSSRATALPIIETFSNLNPNNLKAYFHSLSIDRADIPEVKELVSLTSEEQTMVLNFAKTLYPYELTCDEIYSNEKPVLKNMSIINDSRKGKLFLTFLKIKELANAHSAYPYLGSTNASVDIRNFTEPDSKLYYRSTDTVYEVFEYHKGTYSESGIPEYKKGYDSYLNAVRDLNSSSADNVRIYFDWRTISEDTVKPSSISFKYIELLSWLDGCKIKFTFYRQSAAVQTSEWIPLSTCIKTGVDVPSNVHNCDIEIIVRDLCTLSTTNKLVSDIEFANLFIGGFYPYNPLQIDIEFGYSTQDPLQYTGTAKAGVYYGTQKARRMLTPEGDDVKYIVIDEETT